jgi:hypothetical protein
MSGCKLFDLKIFRNRFQEKNEDCNRKNFKRNPIGLELAGMKDKPLSWLDFFYFLHMNL